MKISTKELVLCCHKHVTVESIKKMLNLSYIEINTILREKYKKFNF